MILSGCFQDNNFLSKQGRFILDVVHEPSLAPFRSRVTTTDVFRHPIALSKGRIPLLSTCSITAPLSTKY